MKTPSTAKIRQSSLRTRELLIDAARQLFARFGVEKTTMNDIAEASKRGRRTVYMYFNSKSDVFCAVVGRELDLLSKRLEAVAESDGSAPEKLMSLIYTHMDTILQVVMRNGSLKAHFFNDIGRVERVRYKFDLREQDIIASILEEGNREGIFFVRDVKMTANILQHAFKGLEVPYIHRQTHRMGSQEFDSLRRAAEYLVFRGVGYRGEVRHFTPQSQEKNNATEEQNIDNIKES